YGAARAGDGDRNRLNDDGLPISHFLGSYCQQTGVGRSSVTQKCEHSPLLKPGDSQCEECQNARDLPDLSLGREPCRWPSTLPGATGGWRRFSSRHSIAVVTASVTGSGCSGCSIQFR